MAKITFRAELRIPRQVILPLLVSTEAQVPRVMVVNQREMDAHPAIVTHFEERYPKWVEAKPQEAPSDVEYLEGMTIAELKDLAATEGIDLGKAKLHAEIVKVIADYKASEEDDEFGSDKDAAEDHDSDGDDDAAADQEAAEDQADTLNA